MELPMNPTWNPEQIEAGMRALVRTLSPDEPLGSETARLVDVVQRHLGCRYNVDALRPIDPRVLAAQMPDPWLREMLVRALVVGMFLDPRRTRTGLRRLQAIALALDVEEPAIGDLELYIAGKRWRLRRRVLARMWVVEHVKARIAERGWWRTMWPLIYSTVFRRYRNPALAAKFARLRKLPPGTLGREL